MKSGIPIAAGLLWMALACGEGPESPSVEDAGVASLVPVVGGQCSSADDCFTPDEPQDSGTPAPPTIAPVRDAGTHPADAGHPVVDAGTPDAGHTTVDAGHPPTHPDAGVADAGSPDSGVPADWTCKELSLYSRLVVNCADAATNIANENFSWPKAQAYCRCVVDAEMKVLTCRTCVPTECGGLPSIPTAVLPPEMRDPIKSKCVESSGIDPLGAPDVY